MAVRTIDCSACGSTVPYGRLSCSACGELLASVAGAMRPLHSVAAIATPSSIAGAPGDLIDTEPHTAPDPDPVAPVTLEVGPLPATGREGEDVGRSEPLELAPEPLPEVEPEHVWTAGADPRAVPSVLHEADELPAPTRQVDDGPVDDRATLGWPPAIEPATLTGTPVSWPIPTASPAQPVVADAARLPGAYLPPSPAAPAAAVGMAAMSFPIVDTPPVPAPARAWAGLRADDGQAGDATPRKAVGDELRALTDPAQRDEMIGWVAVAGGMLGAIGFLLPWSRTVIGSDGIDYFSSWGFAGPGHLFVVVGMLAVVALALVGVRVPTWIRLGAPGLFLGGLVIGLAWPYLVGPLGAMPGVWLSVVGAGLLSAASIAALVGARHGARPQDV